jgi:hypothetical protein
MLNSCKYYSVNVLINVNSVKSESKDSAFGRMELAN